MMDGIILRHSDIVIQLELNFDWLAIMPMPDTKTVLKIIIRIKIRIIKESFVCDFQSTDTFKCKHINFFIPPTVLVMRNQEPTVTVMPKQVGADEFFTDSFFKSIVLHHSGLLVEN